METERTSQVILRASAKKADALRFAPGHHELFNCNNRVVASFVLLGLAKRWS